mmetsp:Transcript_34693/g.60998  ORF Transcript_34693/g.60998 Transcript_34693/m.60998 type:complete len:107 (+) Transcript_34693:329-649(+)
MQGLILAAVYFALQKMGKEECLYINTSSQIPRQLTVEEIRSSVKTKSNGSQKIDDFSETFNFNIFDGAPDVDSPWARYLDQDHSDDEVDGQDRDGETLPNENVEQS